MIWIIFVIILPLAIIIGGILFFNIYMRKKIKQNITPKPIMDQAYIEAEQTRAEDEDFGSVFGGRINRE